MANTPVRIMVVGAHPFDPFERAGGTVAKHLARGDQAMLVSLTYGVVTHAFKFFPPTGADKLRDMERVKEMKQQEFEQAARILGATAWQLLDFPESPLLAGLNEYIALVNLMREFRPDVLLCPHPNEVGRHDHMDCGRIAIAAMDYVRTDGFPSPLAPHTIHHLFMFYYEDFRSEQLMGTARHAPEVVVDITETFDRKIDAASQFATTQTRGNKDFKQGLDEALRILDGYAAFMHGKGTGYAERFVRWLPERVDYLPI